MNQYSQNPNTATFICNKCGWESKPGEVNYYFFIEELDLPLLDKHQCKNGKPN